MHVQVRYSFSILLCCLLSLSLRILRFVAFPSVSDAITDIQKADVEELAGDLAESVTHVAEDVGEIVTNVFVEEIDFEVLSVYMATQGHPEEEKKTEDVVNVEEAVKVKSSETK